MKNLVICICGDNSFHHNWKQNQPDFDLFVVYYGNHSNKFLNDGKYYANSKGTKFIILQDIILKHRDIIEQYDAVFVPDDDLHMETSDVNKFFELFHQYNLEIAQPSILGWISLPITANVNFSILRYTNYVEIMCPCFSKNALKLCEFSFTENRSNWGIEFLWTDKLNNPKDKIAIIDDVIAIHTRPCFFGDTYRNNKNDCASSMQDALNLFAKYKFSDERVVHSTITKDRQEFYDLASEEKIVPNCKAFKTFITGLKTRMVRL